MEAKVEHAANEIKRLKAIINILISVPALPAISSGGQPHQIVRGLTDIHPDTGAYGAVAITVWYAVVRACFFADALSSAVLGYFVFAPFGSSSPTFIVNHTVAVFLIAWICASRRRTERLLIQARSELEAKVEERTAKL